MSGCSCPHSINKNLLHGWPIQDFPQREGYSMGGLYRVSPREGYSMGGLYRISPREKVTLWVAYTGFPPERRLLYGWPIQGFPQSEGYSMGGLYRVFPKEKEYYGWPVQGFPQREHYSMGGRTRVSAREKVMLSVVRIGSLSERRLSYSMYITGLVCGIHLYIYIHISIVQVMFQVWHMQQLTEELLLSLQIPYLEWC